MELLIFAHRGEAQTFLKEINMKLTDESLGFYQTTDKTKGLLICGEGAFEVMSKLPYIIHKFNVDKMINYGIAGALEKSIQLDELFEVRTVYSYLETRPQFKSFTISKNKKAIDCISSIERVTKNDISESLSNYANLVDRELWSIAYIANSLKIPLKSFKLISDFADSSTDCLSIKDRALEYSDKMYDHFTKEKCDLIQQSQSAIDIDINASFSQRKRVERLIKLLINLRPEIDYKTYALEFKKDLTVKSNINPFCDFLEAKLNSTEAKLFTEINQTLSALTKIGVKISLDTKKESSDFTLQMKINSQKNIENLRKALGDFDHQLYLKKWEGDV